MTYKVTEEGNIATVHLDGEIDMDVTEGAKEIIMPLIGRGIVARCAIMVRHRVK